MADIISKLHILVPALLVFNILLGAASQVLAALGKKEIPVLSQLSSIVAKAIDFLGGNLEHK